MPETLHVLTVKLWVPDGGPPCTVTLVLDCKFLGDVYMWTGSVLCKSGRNGECSASLTQRTWIWTNSGRWWRSGKPGVLQSMGSERVRHNLVTEEQVQPTDTRMKQRRLLTSLAFAFSSRRHQCIQTMLLQHTTTRDTPLYSYNLLPQDTLTSSGKTTKYYCSIALQDMLVSNGITIAYYWKMPWDLRISAITSSNHHFCL